MDEVKIAQPMNLTDLLIFTQAAKSKNEARRLIDQGGVARRRSDLRRDDAG
jgi:tyrosyl-tRNA synthetase